MQITHNNKTYKVGDNLHARMLFKCMLEKGDLELIETKPCEHKTIMGGLRGLVCGQCGEKIETKPEEKPTYEIPEYTDWKDDFGNIQVKRVGDHDKAMEIPEVPEYKGFPLDYVTGKTEMNNIHKQLQLLTNSLNAVIKKINNL